MVLNEWSKDLLVSRSKKNKLLWLLGDMSETRFEMYFLPVFTSTLSEQYLYIIRVIFK